MKDASETPRGNEQAKPTTTKSRAASRAKSESATQGSQGQEQGTRPTTQRRTASTASAPPAARSQGSAGEASKVTPTPTVRSQHTPGSTTAGPAGRGRSSTGGSFAPAINKESPSINRGATTPAPIPAQRRTTTQTHGTPLQAPAQRPSGTAPVQRPAGPGGPARPGRRNGSTGHGPARPGTPARPQPGRPGRPAHRPGTPAQRPQERRGTAVKEKPTGPISIPPQIVVKDLAELLQATPNEVIRDLIKQGVFASINQVVEYDKAALVAKEIGFEPQPSASTAVQQDRQLSANEVMMATRNEDNTIVIPPVVTIMGHVDHGKTSLLDTIRKTKVAAGEAGGITQHIGAYQVEVNGKKITFLDTPGHEAFTAMRARGAQGAHIAIIVVAADDGVMPQTREAIDHARAAKVPIIIALNKIDKADANPDFVKQQLYDIGVVIEEFGGEVICVPVSARRGTGIDDLLEMILLLAEVQDIRANPNRTATGLIQQGTLKMGDNILVGSMSGKVRAMFNDRGKRIQKAPPSTPVSVLGLPEVPQAGDHLEVVADERTAKQMATRVAEERRSESMPLGQVSFDTLYIQLQEGNVKELNIVLKCDVQGSAEAIKNALSKLGDENLKVRLIHEGIGNINETDVHLAGASDAVIIG